MASGRLGTRFRGEGGLLLGRGPAIERVEAELFFPSLRGRENVPTAAPSAKRVGKKVKPWRKMSNHSFAFSSNRIYLP